MICSCTSPACAPAPHHSRWTLCATCHIPLPVVCPSPSPCVTLVFPSSCKHTYFHRFKIPPAESPPLHRRGSCPASHPAPTLSVSLNRLSVLCSNPLQLASKLIATTSGNPSSPGAQAPACPHTSLMGPQDSSPCPFLINGEVPCCLDLPSPPTPTQPWGSLPVPWFWVPCDAPSFFISSWA